MKKTSVFVVLFICMLCVMRSYADPFISPMPGNDTVCPGEAIFYNLNPDGVAGCGTLTWTITNGSFELHSDVTTITTRADQSVVVYWRDVAGTGQLKVTAACANSYALSKTSSYAIRSLKGRTPANPRALQSLEYCSTSPIQLMVDVMYLENTGGSTGVTQQQADGYEWVLPTGWSSNGSTGTVRTTANYITITPATGCSGGSVSVKAYKNCVERKYSSAATISVARVGFSSSLPTPPGYTRPNCGNTTPVTFTAKDLSCAAYYRWIFPAGYTGPGGTTGSYITPTNSITLTPSGSAADVGMISVEISIGGCETKVQHFSTPNFGTPPAKPQFASGSTALLCSAGSGIVSIEPVSDAVSYTWYAISDGTFYIDGVAYTEGSPLTTPSSSVTVSVPSLSSIGYGTSVYVIANGKPGCPGSAPAPHPVWAGPPKRDVFIEGPGMMVDGDILYTYNVGHTGATTYTWSLNNNLARIRFTYSSPLEKIMTASLQRFIGEGVTNLSLSSENSCGTSVIGPRPIRVGPCPGEMNNTGCGIIIERTPGTPDAALSVYPNPTSQQINIELLREVTEPGNTNPVTVRLLNSKAAVVYTAHHSSKNIFIPVNDLPRGYYVVKIQLNDQELTRTVWIEH
jgi:hypothetical protein